MLFHVLVVQEIFCFTENIFQYETGSYTVQEVLVFEDMSLKRGTRWRDQNTVTIPVKLWVKTLDSAMLC